MYQHHLDEAARKAVLQNGGYVLPSGAVLRRDPAKAPPVGAVPVPDFKQGVVEAVQAVLSRLRYREDIVCQTTVSPASAQSLPVTGGRVGIAFNGIAAATFYTWRVVRNGGAIDDNLPAHEGNNRADRDTLVVDVSILMPTLSDDCYLTRAHANRLVGYWLHEIGHALFTDATAFSAAAKESVALRHFTNALEDARQERVMCNSGVAPNARPVF